MSDDPLLARAAEYAQAYVRSLPTRRVFPDWASVDALREFEGSLPEKGEAALAVLDRLQHFGSPATVASSGPNYFGFVIGGTLPVSLAAEQLVLAWDQCASAQVNSPVADKIEGVAGQWILEVLDLPRDSAVGFGTSATACGLSCLATARAYLLRRLGWDIDTDGLGGAPEIKVYVSEKAHVTIAKALRILGFGSRRVVSLRCDAQGRVAVRDLPELDATSILCLQAGEVNTGEFDPFTEILPRAREAGAWVHVDGAFGLWARAAHSYRHLCLGVELADSWTTDAHKWLNTPYDAAMAICRHPEPFYACLNGDAVYANAGSDAQKNRTLEFSRRARGIAVWAALAHLGRAGVDALISRHCLLAQKIAAGLREAGCEVLNRVVLNQVLARCARDEDTQALLKAVQQSGKSWFGASVWQGRPAFRISVSCWQTEESHIEALLALIRGCLLQLKS